MTKMLSLIRRAALASILSATMATTFLASQASAQEASNAAKEQLQARPARELPQPNAPQTGAEDCAPKASHCDKDSLFCFDVAIPEVFGTADCSKIPAHCPRPSYCPEPKQNACGEHWTDWRAPFEVVDNPCPAGCRPTEKVERETRATDQFFRVQYRERWACDGAPLTKSKASSRDQAQTRVGDEKQ